MLQSACNTCALSLGAIRTSSSLLRVLAALDSRTCAQNWLGLLQPPPGRDQHPRDFAGPARAMSSAADPLLEGEHAEASGAASLAELHRVAPLQLPSGVKKTYYKRVLPCPPATEFSSEEGGQQQPMNCKMTVAQPPKSGAAPPHKSSAGCCSILTTTSRQGTGQQELCWLCIASVSGSGM
jgi:hypothetical protein